MITDATTLKYNLLERGINWAMSNRNFLIFLILTLGLLPTFIAYHGFYIVGDGALQEYPFIYETKRMLMSGAPWWSWNTFFGDDFIVNYSYYTVFNIFALVNCLFPIEYIGIGYTLMLYVKFLVLGWVSEEYFKKIGFRRPLTLIGSLLFTFSSWLICNQLYYFFIEPVILMMILLICIERYFNNEPYSKTCLIIAVGVLTISNFYFAPASLLMGSIYFVCRIFSMPIKGSARMRLMFKAMCCVFIGLMLAAIVLLPIAHYLTNSGRTNLAETPNIKNIIYRFLTLFFPMYIEGRLPLELVFSKWFSNEANIAILGCLPAILYLRRHLKSWPGILLVICIVMYLTPLTGLPLMFTSYEVSRWAYFLTLAIVIVTLYYLKEHDTLSLRSVLWYSAFVLMLYGIFGGAKWYILLFRTQEPWAYEHSQIFVLGVLILLNLAALLMVRKKILESNARRFIIAFASCVIVQYMFFTFVRSDYSKMCSNNYAESSRYLAGEKMKYRDISEPFVSRTDFRTRNPYFFLYQNLATRYNIPSVQSYNSMRNPMLDDLYTVTQNDAGSMLQVYSPLHNRTSFDALMSVEHFIDFNDHLSDEPRPDSLSLVEHTEHYSKYKFGYYIPMGYAYDKYMVMEEVKSAYFVTPKPDIPLAMLNAIAIKDADQGELSKYLEKAEFDTSVSIDSVVDARRSMACGKFEGDTKGFTASIDLDKPRLVFISVPWSEGFTAKVDGKQTKIYNVNFGLCGVIVPQGQHTIRFDFMTVHLMNGLYVSMIGLLSLFVVFMIEYKNGRKRKA